MGVVLQGEILVSLRVNPENKLSFWESWHLLVKVNSGWTKMTKWPELAWKITWPAAE